MGKYIDFAVKYDPKTETEEDLTKKILYVLFIKRIKAKKPVVTFIGADSGEGKSYSALKLMLLLLEMQGLPFKDLIEDVNVFTPIEYPTKLNNLLFPSSAKRYYKDKINDKEELERKLKLLKKANVICMHEARDIVKAKNWQSFLNQAISDVNAMSRSIKRICFFVISQFIRDISTDIRYTLNYYITITRPIGKKARLSISVMWKDDRDLEKPKLRKRKIRGYIIDPKGRRKLFIPKYLELTVPPKEVTEVFEKRDFEAKAMVIRRKMDKLISNLKTELELDNTKIKTMVEWYFKNQNNLSMIGRRVRKKWKLKPEARAMHDLSDTEALQFEEMINERLKQEGSFNEDIEVIENELQ